MSGNTTMGEAFPARRLLDPLLAKSMVRRALLVLGGVVAMAGCAFQVGHLATVSTRRIAIDAARPPASDVVWARSCVWVATVFPVTPLPTVGAAIDAALDATGATTLSDVDVYYTLVYLPPLGGRGCYLVAGRPS